MALLLGLTEVLALPPALTGSLKLLPDKAFQLMWHFFALISAQAQLKYLDIEVVKGEVIVSIPEWKSGLRENLP